MAASSRELFSIWRSWKNLANLKHLSVNPSAQIYCSCKRYVSGGRPEMEGSRKGEVISKAMKAYLERAKSYENFMAKETEEYEMGRQHLARIMGVDPNEFTRDDINKAIEYLLPSGLHAKNARPMLKHPSEIVPHRKVAQFGADGRPFHHMFYTGFPEYYSLLHELSKAYEDLKQLAKDGTARNEIPPEKLLMAGSIWLDEKALTKMLGEEIKPQMLANVVMILERLADHPYGTRKAELIMKYRKSLGSNKSEEIIPELLEGESGRLYMTGTGSRKTAKATVTIWAGGDGHVNINGQDLITTFPRTLDREQVMFPLQFTGQLGIVDIEAQVDVADHRQPKYYGESSMAGALRLALARALRSFVSTEVVEQMRLAGLLTRDPRMKERKKFGQEGARRKFTWKKR